MKIEVNVKIDAINLRAHTNSPLKVIRNKKYGRRNR